MQGVSDSQKSSILTVAQSSQVRDPLRLDLDLLCCMMCYSKLALLLEKKKNKADSNPSSLSLPFNMLNYFTNNCTPNLPVTLI